MIGGGFGATGHASYTMLMIDGGLPETEKLLAKAKSGKFQVPDEEKLQTKRTVESKLISHNKCRLTHEGSHVRKKKNVSLH